jgi:hypothetical protein
VEKDEFGSKHFEIPIEEASEWEEISKIQIGIQSVPVIDDIAPIIYIDSVWIETEYEYTNQDGESQLANVASGITDIFGGENNEVIPKEDDYGIEEDTEEELLEDEPEEILEEELLEEEIPQEYVEPVPPSLPLSARSFSKEIVLDPRATHRCVASPFNIDISGRSPFSTDISLKKTPEEEYEIEIGGLPSGIDVTFSKNDDYLYQPGSNEDTVSLSIENEKGSRTGNFTIPIVFTEKEKKDSSVICQINIINYE